MKKAEEKKKAEEGVKKNAEHMSLPPMERIESVAVMVPVSNLKVFKASKEIFTDLSVEEFAALKESIKEHGILEPLVARRSSKPNVMDVLIGGHRLKALIELGYKEAPVLLRDDLPTDEKALLVSIEEQIYRRPLSYADMAKALAKRKELKSTDDKPAEKAETAGVGKRQEQRLVAVGTKLIPEWMDVLEAKNISLEKAHGLAQLEETVQKEIHEAVFKNGADHANKAIAKIDIGKTVEAELKKQKERITKLESENVDKDTEINILTQKLEQKEKAKKKVALDDSLAKYTIEAFFLLWDDMIATGNVGMLNDIEERLMGKGWQGPGL